MLLEPFNCLSLPNVKRIAGEPVAGQVITCNGVSLACAIPATRRTVNKQLNHEAIFLAGTISQQHSRSIAESRWNTRSFCSRTTRMLIGKEPQATRRRPHPSYGCGLPNEWN